MVQVAASPLTFDEFVERYPEDGGRYELRHGLVVEMRPIGPHEEVIALIRRKLGDFQQRKYPTYESFYRRGKRLFAQCREVLFEK